MITFAFVLAADREVTHIVTECFYYLSYAEDFPGFKYHLMMLRLGWTCFIIILVVVTVLVL